MFEVGTQPLASALPPLPSLRTRMDDARTLASLEALCRRWLAGQPSGAVPDAAAVHHAAVLLRFLQCASALIVSLCPDAEEGFYADRDAGLALPALSRPWDDPRQAARAAAPANQTAAHWHSSDQKDRYWARLVSLALKGEQDTPTHAVVMAFRCWVAFPVARALANVLDQHLCDAVPAPLQLLRINLRAFLRAPQLDTRFDDGCLVAADLHLRVFSGAHERLLPSSRATMCQAVSAIAEACSECVAVAFSEAMARAGANLGGKFRRKAVLLAGVCPPGQAAPALARGTATAYANAACLVPQFEALNDVLFALLADVDDEALMDEEARRCKQQKGARFRFYITEEEAGASLDPSDSDEGSSGEDDGSGSSEEDDGSGSSGSSDRDAAWDSDEDTGSFTSKQAGAGS